MADMIRLSIGGARFDSTRRIHVMRPSLPRRHPTPALRRLGFQDRTSNAGRYYWQSVFMFASAESPFVFTRLHSLKGFSQTDMIAPRWQINSREETRIWLKHAEEHWKDATWLLEGRRYSACLYCCHQTLEKALKASVASELRISMGSRQSCEKSLKAVYGSASH